MTLTFRSLGKKFHHSIWCFLTLYVLVLLCLGICFIRWLGVGVQLIILFMILPPRILPPYHMSFSKVLSCLQFCLIGLPPQKLPDWDPLYCFDIPLPWHPMGCDIPLLWHPFALTSQTCGIGCVAWSFEFKSDLGHGPHGSDSMICCGQSHGMVGHAKS